MTYPPNKQECVQLFDELKQLNIKGNNEFNQRKYEIIHDLAESHYYEAKPYFISGLSSPDPDYRWACISALATHWREKDSNFIRKLLNMVQHDDDIQVRIIAISSLGYLNINTAKSLLEKISISKVEDKDIIEAAKEAISKLSV